jgi:perosamine synthetase
MKTSKIFINSNKSTRKLAILGGEPVISSAMIRSGMQEQSIVETMDDLIRTTDRGVPITQRMVDSVLKTVRSGIWSRIQDSESGAVATFEKEFAKLFGTKYCLGTGAGTQALSTSVEAMGIGAGDEVITSPYTDVGTISGILFSRALPVLADLDPESFQLDPDDVERRITENTKAIMPVHIAGNPANMERIMAIAKKHNLMVIEDACQAHLTQYQGKRLGTIGHLGCFSFQASKNMACGEGGAIIGDDEELMDKCYTVHNRGDSRRGRKELIGPKYRMNELEAALLLPQFDNVHNLFNLRNENCYHMNSKLSDIPGIVPQKLYKGTGASSWHLYLTQYKKEHFNNTSRAKFIDALRAEGVGITAYIANGFHRNNVIANHILDLDVYKKMFSASRLKKYREELHLPNCDRVTDEINLNWTGIPTASNIEEVDRIFDAVMKVYENRDQLSSL